MATVSKDMPKKPGFTGKKVKTNDLYMEAGKPCGDIGGSQYEPSNIGKGNTVGGNTSFGIHHAFENGIPNAGREDISAEVMKPVHNANVKESVLSTEEDATWGGKIAPQEYGVHNTIGVK